MDVLLEDRANTRQGYAADDNECLVDLVDHAENAKGGVDENSELAAKLDRHVLLDGGDKEVELMCRQCPVQCTIKLISGTALSLVHNREECIR